ncbi:MAG TPA: hypothetical protein V6D19_15320 [Stenomitos sp.]
MKLPNADRAVIAREKLISYCLNSEHPKGKHKARVFHSVLGITRENADDLYKLIQQAALSGEVVQQRLTSFGQEFKVDWDVSEFEGVQLRTIWIIPVGETNPQLVSAFIRT